MEFANNNIAVVIVLAHFIIAAFKMFVSYPFVYTLILDEIKVIHNQATGTTRAASRKKEV